jgi:hypothetical protein
MKYALRILVIHALNDTCPFGLAIIFTYFLTELGFGSNNCYIDLCSSLLFFFIFSLLIAAETTFCNINVYDYLAGSGKAAKTLDFTQKWQQIDVFNVRSDILYDPFTAKYSKKYQCLSAQILVYDVVGEVWLIAVGKSLIHLLKTSPLIKLDRKFIKWSFFWQ